MKKLVTTMCIIGALCVAAQAFAISLPMRSPLPKSLQVQHPKLSSVILTCDDGTEYNAYYQAATSRYGNLFDFGTSSRLTTVAFVHLGFGFSGPYNYGLQIWDPTSCTLVKNHPGLVAADAADAPATEVVDLCADLITLSGLQMVMVNPGTCLAPTDCYPDLMFDDQTGVVCPVVVQTATTTPACFDLSANSGPFLLGIELNNCSTPTQKQTWGHVKSIYR